MLQVEKEAEESVFALEGLTFKFRRQHTIKDPGLSAGKVM